MDDQNSDAFKLNNTRKSNIDIVIFNRVPKCGTQSMNVLIVELGYYNNFSHSRNAFEGRETIFLNSTKLSQWLKNIFSKPRPHVYNQHIAYINFTEHNMPKPIYINMVRDPVERLVSWHYYVRAEWRREDIRRRLGNKQPQEVPKKMLKMDFDTCVKLKHKECTYIQGDTYNPNHRSQILFFCGQDKKFCLPFNTKAAMQRAKRTVEEEYAVVGTWEHTNMTLSVLQHFIPKFFRNAKEVFYWEKDRLSSVNKNPDKKPISEKTRSILRKNLTYEIEFYEFCKHRLFKQYATIGAAYSESDEYYLSSYEDGTENESFSDYAEN